MPLPAARGPLGVVLRAVLTGAAPTSDFLDAVRSADATRTGAATAVLHDEDVQACLTTLYELALQGVAGVSDDFEWDLELLAARAVLEAPLAAALDELADGPRVGPDGVVAALQELTADTGRPGLSHRVARDATLAQVQELLTHRAPYQLREADPHTMGIPRLAGAPKGALVEVQADEYGGGRPERMHSALFARTLRALGVPDAYGSHVDRVPAVTLASLNALSYLALHRARLGELVGHLCAVEMTSSLPSKLHSAGLRRLGFDRSATLFYDEHVEADAMHEQVVARDLAGGLARAQPHRADAIVRGARICLALDDLVAAHLTASWDAGRSSLRTPEAVGA
jgi:hypothetical protein